MKNLLITNENINYIGGVINKIISKSKEKTIISQHFYPANKRLQGIYNLLKLDNFVIINSVKNKFNIVNVEFRELLNKKYININNGNNTTMFSWKASVITINSRISIKNNVIYLTETDISKNTKIVIKIIIK